MTFPCRSSPAALPASLSSQLWRGDEFAMGMESVSTGTPLDAQLPDAGWPLDGMVEILSAEPGRHVWQLLAPALAKAAGDKKGPVVLVGAPHEPFGPGLAARGLPAERLLCIRADKPAARLWSTEQALRCADVAAVLAWIPQARNPELRRLHMAAQQHPKLFFAFRGLDARSGASPARLRMVLTGIDEMQVQVIKRRGPPMDTALVLAARGARLAELLQARRKRAQVSGPIPSTTAIPMADATEGIHALDRTSAAA
ncbi:MAG: translesion DNA synthesis-associated protein ImuA [Burkholderiaceae bacterium]